MGIILLLVVVVIIIVCIVNSGSGESNIVYSMDSPEVDSSFVWEVVLFLDGYLSLCAKHSVHGVCLLSDQSADSTAGRIDTKMECTIFEIDNLYGSDAFRILQNVAIQDRDDYIKEYFGRDLLHRVYIDADEYCFDVTEAIISYNRPLFTRSGAKLAPTLSVIKQEILKKWENATVDITSFGISVKP